MIRNYLLVALRNFRRNKFISFINVFGLAVAMTATLLILQYVSFHLNFDRSLNGWNQIYRLGNEWSWTDSKGRQITRGPAEFGQGVVRLEQDFPEIESATWFKKVRFKGNDYDAPGHLWIHPTNDSESTGIKVKDFISADSNFFKILSFPIEGSESNKALREPNQAVISNRLAKKLFGTEAAAGRQVFIDGKTALHVTAVYFPRVQSTLQYDLILSIPRRLLDWRKDGTYSCLFKTRPGTNIDVLHRQVDGQYQEYHADLLQTFSEVQAESHPTFQRLDDVHFDRYGNRENFQGVTYPKSIFYGLLVAGLIISSIAFANYFNLATAQLATRVREIGIRKVIGASRKGLLLQYWFESLLIMTFAFCVALTISQFIQPHLSSLGLEVQDGYLLSQWWFPPLILMTLLISSMVIATFKMVLLGNLPISHIFRGKIGIGKLGGRNYQKVFLGIQMMCTVGLIVGAVIVHRQVSYVINLDKGYSTENTIVIEAPNDALRSESVTAFFNDLNQLAGTESVTGSWSFPGQHGQQEGGFAYREGSQQFYGLNTNGPVHDNFAEFFDLQMVAGRNFREHYSPDTANILISEHALLRLEFNSPEEALNARLFQYQGAEQDTALHNSYRIIGVFKDYFMNPLHLIQEKRGIFLTVASTSSNSPYRYFFVRHNAQNPVAFITDVKSVFEAHFRQAPFDFFALDETMNANYLKDMTLRSVLVIFSSVAVILSFLGLFAILSQILIQRTKEIGIRKIMGAGLGSLFPLYSGTYIKIALINAAVAIPLIHWLATEWLNGYAVRIELSWTTFAVPVLGLAILMLALLFAQIHRVTRANPVDSLRYE